MVYFASQSRVDDRLITQRRVQTGKKREPVKEFHVVLVASPVSGRLRSVSGNTDEIILHPGGTGWVIEQEVHAGLLIVE